VIIIAVDRHSVFYFANNHISAEEEIIIIEMIKVGNSLNEEHEVLEVGSDSERRVGTRVLD
jgi:hypothetical protein